MKKAVVLCAVLFAFVANTFAQSEAPAPLKERKEKKEKKEVKEMKEVNEATAVTAPKEGQKPESWKSLLGLTAEQDAKMKEIGKANKEKTEAIKNDATADKDQKKAKSAEQKKAYETELKAVLSAEQFTKYVDIQKQRKEAMKANQGAKAPEKQ